MDHNEAVRLQAAEKYVLGEFPLNLRDEYEEHFFDCADCAVDVKAIAAFADTTREVLRRNEAASAHKATVPARGGWLAWLRPIVAVPAFAGLVLVIGYQNLVSIPRSRSLAEQAAAEAAAPHVLPTFSLLGANQRGGGRPIFQATSGKPFILKVDIPETEASPSASYLLRLENASGVSHSLGAVSNEAARNTVFVEVPAGFPAGNAQLVVLEVAQTGATPREITTLPFVVAFGPGFEQHP